MHFIDRITLGETFADRLRKYRDKDTVIICLNESSLLTCLTMAIQLRAWVYPLVWVPVRNDDDMVLGAFDQDGEFCALPSHEHAKQSDQSIASVVADRMPQAKGELKKQLDQYSIEIRKHVLDGRNVILVSDVLLDPLPLIVAQNFLKKVSPKSLTTIIGNASPDVAELAHMSAESVSILDVLSGTVADESHYFESLDPYTPQQKHALTQQIAAYWE